MTHSPYQYTTGITNVATPTDANGASNKNISPFKTMYADDNSAYNKTWGSDGMQTYVNAAMLFFGFSGLKLNIDKSSVCWLQHSGDRTMRPLLNPVPLKRRLPAAFCLYDVHQPPVCRPKDPGNGNGGSTAIGFDWRCKAC
jgi:hypothetical protein